MDGREGMGAWQRAAAVVVAAGFLTVAAMTVLPHTAVRTVGGQTVEICTATGIELAVIGPDGAPVPAAGLFGHVLGCGECVARSAILLGSLGLAAAILALGAARGRAQGRESVST
ncbi:MAG: hypothetical protein ACK5YI_04200 [Rhodospirillales bacterium]|jgi:hypothetical protein